MLRCSRKAVRFEFDHQTDAFPGLPQRKYQPTKNRLDRSSSRQHFKFGEYIENNVCPGNMPHCFQYGAIRQTTALVKKNHQIGICVNGWHVRHTQAFVIGEHRRNGGCCNILVPTLALNRQGRKIRRGFCSAVDRSDCQTVDEIPAAACRHGAQLFQVQAGFTEPLITSGWFRRIDLTGFEPS